MISLGIVGCGAVTEICHLPASQLSRGLKIVALADTNTARAKLLGERFGVEYWTADYHQLLPRTDGVVIALPHHLHAPVAKEFLSHKVSVLVEKPLALTVEEAKGIIETAVATGTLLQAGYMYRFCEGARLVKQAIDEGWLGPLRRFSLESGYVYQWPVTSGFSFCGQQAGGGVLIDTGSHMLDLLLWWLGGVESLDYRDDWQGGIESDCSLLLTVRSATGPVHGEVTLSRLRQLSDRVRIVGERFTIEYDVSTNDRVRLWPSSHSGEALSFRADYDGRKKQKWIDVYADQLDAFAQGIALGRRPAVSAESVLPAVELIERCYKNRQPVEWPWLRPVSI